MTKNNKWTGGQYSIFRIVLGSYLLIHFSMLIPWAKELFSNQGLIPYAANSPLIHIFPNILAFFDSPLFLIGFLFVAIVGSIVLIFGWKDRFFAVIIWYVLACLLGRNPLISNPSLPYIGWMLLAHACIPFIPYGSWKARGKIAEAVKWHFPQSLFIVAWIVLAISYTYSGYTKLISPSWLDGTAIQKVLENPLARPGYLRLLILSMPPILLKLMTWGGLSAELFFAPIALFRKLRPWIWLLLLIMHIGLIVLIDFADLSFGMILIHFFTFDPAWIKPKKAQKFYVFYDSVCGLCNRFVQFILLEDIHKNIQLAPLKGQTFKNELTIEVQRAIPDTIVVYFDQKLLTKSSAIIELFKHLGGLWKVFGYIVSIIPKSFRDVVYDFIAKNRQNFFSNKKQICSLLPRSLLSDRLLD